MATQPKRIFDHLRDRVLDRIGPVDQPKHVIPPLTSLQATEWFPQFEAEMRDYFPPGVPWLKEDFFELMRNRLVFGAFRYGLFDRKSTSKWNYCIGQHDRLNLYFETGNSEWLVDVANFALCITKQDDPRRGCPDLVIENRSEWNHLVCTKLLSLLNRFKDNPYENHREVVLLAVQCWIEYSRPQHPNAHLIAVETGVHNVEH